MRGKRIWRMEIEISERDKEDFKSIRLKISLEIDFALKYISLCILAIRIFYPSPSLSLNEFKKGKLNLRYVGWQDRKLECFQGNSSFTCYSSQFSTPSIFYSFTTKCRWSSSLDISIGNFLSIAIRQSGLALGLTIIEEIDPFEII